MLGNCRITIIALQLDDHSFIVYCGDYNIFIINECGNYIQKFSPSNDCHKMASPCLAVDNYGNTYVGGCNVLVLGQKLSLNSFRSIHGVRERVRKMYFNEVNGTLLVLVRTNKAARFLTFRL